MDCGPPGLPAVDPWLCGGSGPDPLKLLAFLGLFVCAHVLLHALPGISELARRLPILTLLASGMIAAWGSNRWLERSAAARIRGARLRELELQDSPEARGKLGVALLDEKRAGTAHVQRAAELLQVAHEEAPERADWAFRLGQARARLGEHEAAIEALAAAIQIDEEHAYGSAVLELAGVQEKLGDSAAALLCLERFERNHGPSPESAFRRALALRELGRRDEASAAFAEVATLAQNAPAFQAAEAAKFARQARLQRLR